MSTVNTSSEQISSSTPLPSVVDVLSEMKIKDDEKPSQQPSRKSTRVKNVLEKELAESKKPVKKGKKVELKSSSSKVTKKLKKGSKGYKNLKQKVESQPSHYVRRPALKRLARRGGVKRLSNETYDELRDILSRYLNQILKHTLTVTHFAGRKTVSTEDVVFALKQNNSPIYGML